jgi:hypothetical protein
LFGDEGPADEPAPALNEEDVGLQPPSPVARASNAAEERRRLLQDLARRQQQREEGGGDDEEVRRSAPLCCCRRPSTRCQLLRPVPLAAARRTV